MVTFSPKRRPKIIIKMIPSYLYALIFSTNQLERTIKIHFFLFYPCLKPSFLIVAQRIHIHLQSLVIKTTK